MKYDEFLDDEEKSHRHEVNRWGQALTPRRITMPTTNVLNPTWVFYVPVQENAQDESTDTSPKPKAG